MAELLRCDVGDRRIERFPDGEIDLEVAAEVAGRSVHLVQPTPAPVGESLLELLLLADACRRLGASRLTAVIPYLGYARADHRARERGALGGRVVADLIGTARFDALIAVDLHKPALEGFFAAPVRQLSAVPLLSLALIHRVPRDAVVVAADLGAARLAQRFGQALDLPVAVVHNIRLSLREVQVVRVVGDVRGRAALIVDDMIDTAATVTAAARTLLEAGCSRRVVIAAPHALLADPARERLRALPVEACLVTDSLGVAPSGIPALEVHSIAPLLATEIGRMERR
jgi:ribose-phosphate pyrophosphokinase